MISTVGYQPTLCLCGGSYFKGVVERRFGGCYARIRQKIQRYLSPYNEYEATATHERATSRSCSSDSSVTRRRSSGATSRSSENGSRARHHSSRSCPNNGVIVENHTTDSSHEDTTSRDTYSQTHACAYTPLAQVEPARSLQVLALFSPRSPGRDINSLLPV